VIQRLKQWLKGEEAAAAQPAVRILMVCTGNICRSPTAEGVLRTKLQQAGLTAQFGVDSAGTQGFHTNEPPDRRAIAAAARRGYDLSGLKARPVLPHDFARFQWLLAMDQTHLDWLHKRAVPGSAAKAGLLMQFAGRHPGVEEVPDPYYGGPEGFEHVLDLLEDACDGVVARLRSGLPLLPSQV
jgi:protein-tyrosine phosphatase